MMINCPKCNFLQPKDQYCAQCGVNMETYRPPTAPLYQRILSNWMVQLGLLFVLILTVVVWDNFSRTPDKTYQTELPPVASNIARSQERAENSYPETSPRQEMEVSPTTQQQEFAPEKELQPQQQEPKVVTFKKRVTFKILTLLPVAIDGLSQQSSKVDEGVYKVNRDQNGRFMKSQRSALQSHRGSSSFNFEFNQPVDFFWGEVDQETGVNLGFFAQVIVNENSTADSISGEVRFWHQLKLSDSPSSPVVVEFNVASREALYIIDPTVHDNDFSNEEVTLFDSSDRLSALNDVMFTDSGGDMAAYIEFQ
jgi:hypothetical protein